MPWLRKTPFNEQDMPRRPRVPNPNLDYSTLAKIDPQLMIQAVKDRTGIDVMEKMPGLLGKRDD